MRQERSRPRERVLVRAMPPTAASRAIVRQQRRRRARILANMEMWRWEPRDMGERRIEVNMPDFTVAMLEGDALVHSARVIVGKPDTPTPIFSNAMRYMLINPVLARCRIRSSGRRCCPGSRRIPTISAAAATR